VGLYRPSRAGAGDSDSFQRYYDRDDPLPKDLEHFKQIRALEEIKSIALDLQARLG
jgi:hypothetical protein